MKDLVTSVGNGSWIRRSSKSKITAVALLCGLLPFLLSLSAYFIFGNEQHVNNPLHEWFELTGSCIALAVAMLLLMHEEHERKSAHLMWVAAGLTAMGLVDMSHSVCGVSDWFWQRQGSTFIGGIFFTLVWFPIPQSFSRHKGIFILAAAAIGITLGTICEFERLSMALNEIGLYLPLKKSTNILGGLGFLSAAVFFFRKYLNQPKGETLAFAGLTLLFGMSGLFSTVIHRWAADWWVWHGYRFLAYFIMGMIAYALVFRLYKILETHAQGMQAYLQAGDEKLRKTEWELRRLIWMLDFKNNANQESQGMPFGDVVQLNTCRIIRDSVGGDMLSQIVGDYHDLLGTSAAVYERNGDYAMGVFSSGWCRFLNTASRSLCGSDDNRVALESGKWLCHESCWTRASKVTVETGSPVDNECDGGLRIYAVPIRAGDEIVGSINLAYGDPPREPGRLRELASKFRVSLDDLRRHANSYESRPPFIIEIAKKRLAVSAQLIGEIIRRKKMEVENSRLLERSDLAVHAAGIGIWDWDIKKDNLIWDERMHELYGIAKDGFAGGSGAWMKCIHPDDGSRFDIELRQALRGEKDIDTEFRILRPDGSIRHLRAFAQVIRDTDNNPKRMIGINLDITVRKKAEAELAREQNLLNSLITNIPDHIYFKDRRSRFIRISPSLAKLFGLNDPAEAVGKSDADFFGPEHANQAYADEQRIMSSGESLVGAEEKETWPDGRVTWVSTTKVPLRNSAGEIVGLVGISRDITGHKLAELALHESEKQYQRLFEASRDAVMTLIPPSWKAADQVQPKPPFKAPDVRETCEMRQQPKG